MGRSPIGCLVFGELVFDGAVDWIAALTDRLHAILQFDQEAYDEVLQLDVRRDRLRLRACLHGDAFQSWCPQLEALVAAAARLGAVGEMIFAGRARAYRMAVDDGRVRVTQTPFPDNEHPAVIEIALLVETRAVDRQREGVSRSSHRVQVSGA